MPIPKLRRRPFTYNERTPGKGQRGTRRSWPGGGGVSKGHGSSGQNGSRARLWLHRLTYALAALVLFFAGSMLWANQKLPDPNRLSETHFAESSKIYDRTGDHLLYEIFAEEKRTLIELTDIPQYLIDGVIATEDKKFYDHMGIRPLSILRALAYGIFTKRKIAGTSTLTQQLVKNAILTNERTVARKIKEAVLALRLEQKYSKQDILKIYFNEIPYGSTNYGVEAAANSYFGKHANELTLAEAATLAGLPQKPSVYLNNLPALKTRRNFVLSRMVEEGYLKQDEADKAKAEELNLKRQSSALNAPHFVLYVKEKLVENYGESMVEKGGLKIITTLDWDKQQVADKAVQEFGKKLLETGGANNAALVALDPKTSQIFALVGSRDFHDETIDGQFNVVTHALRQPGSSIKPIFYAAAFEKGFTPNTVLFDVVTSFPDNARRYTPHNYDLTEHGPVTMRKALQGSLNIVAVKTLYLVGLPRAFAFAERLGYTTFRPSDIGFALVLGGGGVKMLEHVNAYAVLANGGTHHSPVSILKVTDSRGKILYEWKEEPGRPVLDQKITAAISSVLSDDTSRAFVFGAGSALTLPGRPVAAKSGTTNNYVDAWVVGYTPSLVAGVWGGNTDNKPMKPGFGGTKVAGQIWNYFMKEALKNSPVENFPAPPPVTVSKPMLDGMPNGGVKLLIDEVTGKIATSSTPEKYIVEKVFLPPHDILHYVDKDNPTGSIPRNPAIDPEYIVWERAIEDWINNQREKNPSWDVSFEAPPTEYDDLHSLELIPTLEVVYPTNGQTLTSREIVTDVRVSAPRGIAKVSYKIDGTYAGVINTHPFNLHYTDRTLTPGTHILTVTAEDDIGNRVSEEVSFTLSVPPEPAGVYFKNPPESLNENGFPFTFILTTHQPTEIAIVNIIATEPQSQTKFTLHSTSDVGGNLFENQYGATWQNFVSPGLWKIDAVVKLKDGSERTSDTIMVEVKK